MMPTWHHPDFEGQGYDDYENPKKLLLDHTLGATHIFRFGCRTINVRQQKFARK